MNYVHVNPKFDALNKIRLASDAMDFRVDIDYMRRTGAALLAYAAPPLPDMYQATVDDLGYNPSVVLWPIDVAGQAIAAWKRSHR